MTRSKVILPTCWRSLWAADLHSGGARTDERSRLYKTRPLPKSSVSQPPFGNHERFTSSSSSLTRKLSKSETSGKSPAEGKDGQAEEGAEGGIERLDLGGSLGSPQPPVSGAVRFIAHGDITSAWDRGKQEDLVE